MMINQVHSPQIGGQLIFSFVPALRTQLNIPALSAEVSRDELHGMTSTGGDSSSGGAASPLTARSLRLERVAQALAHSQEELRR